MVSAETSVLTAVCPTTGLTFSVSSKDIPSTFSGMALSSRSVFAETNTAIALAESSTVEQMTTWPKPFLAGLLLTLLKDTHELFYLCDSVFKNPIEQAEAANSLLCSASAKTMAYLLKDCISVNSKNKRSLPRLDLNPASYIAPAIDSFEGTLRTYRTAFKEALLIATFKDYTAYEEALVSSAKSTAKKEKAEVSSTTEQAKAIVSLVKDFRPEASRYLAMAGLSKFDAFLAKLSLQYTKVIASSVIATVIERLETFEDFLAALSLEDENEEAEALLEDTQKLRRMFKDYTPAMDKLSQALDSPIATDEYKAYEASKAKGTSRSLKDILAEKKAAASAKTSAESNGDSDNESEGESA